MNKSQKQDVLVHGKSNTIVDITKADEALEIGGNVVFGTPEHRGELSTADIDIWSPSGPVIDAIFDNVRKMLDNNDKKHVLASRRSDSIDDKVRWDIRTPCETDLSNAVIVGHWRRATRSIGSRNACWRRSWGSWRSVCSDAALAILVGVSLALGNFLVSGGNANVAGNATDTSTGCKCVRRSWTSCKDGSEGERRGDENGFQEWHFCMLYIRGGR